LAVAPMAGGPTTVALVTAASSAGAFAFLAGGYKKAAELEAEIAAVRAAGVDRFGVNVFVPGAPTEDLGRLREYLAALESEAAALGASLGTPSWDDDEYPAKIEMLLGRPPAAVSFTFGIPGVKVVRALQAGGAVVIVTVTTPEEAQLALRVGPDALALQGAEAGAHRGSLRNDDVPDADRPLRALLAGVRRRTLVPLVAAGGVGGPDDVVDLLKRGATVVQAGTAFLRSPESGAAQLVKDSLGEPRFAGAGTIVTRAFSGRRARSIANAMAMEHPDAPPAYPEINNATRPLRAAALRAGDAEHTSLFAGTAFEQAEPLPAADIVARLVSGLRQ
jgi:nitronate monooxygenase